VKGESLTASAGPIDRKKGLESRAALQQRRLQKSFAVGRREQVEHEQDGRRLGGELFYAAFRRVQPHLQRVERECLADRDGELAVEDEAARLQSPQCRYHLREVAPQRLSRFGPQIHFVAGTEGEAPEPVPFGLELPARLLWQFVDEPRLHRRQVQGQRKSR
jgi:hypothetical protein